jgi:hypothetical protein
MTASPKTVKTMPSAKARPPKWIELGFRKSAEIAEAEPGERLAEDGGVLNQLSFGRRKAVEAGRNQRLERVRDLEWLDRPGGRIDVPVLHEQPAVEQHPHGLDRVQGNSLGAIEDVCV